MTTATFSCIEQSTALGCFPCLKIIYTSRKFMGQICISVMNWFLLALVLVFVCNISSVYEIGNAYGFVPAIFEHFLTALPDVHPMIIFVCIKVFITLESTPEAMFRTDYVNYALIGLMRDFRGITMATNSRRTYGLLFDWIYPAHMPILLRGISHCADTPERFGSSSIPTHLIGAALLRGEWQAAVNMVLEPREGDITLH
ncbi:hypothetical protein OROMI_017107 [Orobanche minor]